MAGTTLGPEREDGLCLLSLDGGGVRGLSTLQIIRQLMHQVHPENPPKPCDFFDMIGGTSTGGLIAIMLGRLKMDVDECINRYTKLADKVFRQQKHRVNVYSLPWNWEAQGRFDSEALTQCIKDIVKDKGIDENTLLKDEPDSKCKVFVCATSERITKTVALTSYHSERWPDDLLNSVTIWEAGRATAAATTYFDPMELGPFKERFVDGAVGANNPVWELWDEAANVWGKDRPLETNLKCLVSIGTGMPSLKPFGGKLVDVGKGLLAIATETETTAERFLRHHTKLDDEHRYFRFNVLKGLEEIGLEDSQNLNSIAAATRDYLGNERVRKEISRCAELMETREWRARMDDAISNATSDVDTALSKHRSRAQECQRREDDTAEWFLELPEYQTWLLSPTTAILWHPGIPGSGKTTLITALINRYLTLGESAGKKVAFYFCESSSNRESSSTRDEKAAAQVTILKSLAAQLLKDRKDQLEGLVARLKDGPRRLLDLFGLNHRGSKIDLRAGLWELVWLIFQQYQDLKPLVFIDGVDELPLKIRQEFLQSLCQMVSDRKTFGASFFLTSRPYEDIKRTLECVPTIDPSLERKYCLTSLFFDDWQSRRVDVAESLEGTFQWVWSHKSYRNWLDHRSGILWIQGKPGSGKSTLAKMIQQRFTRARSAEGKSNHRRLGPAIMSQPVIADFFYSSRKGDVATSHQKMLRSLLYQILDQDPSLYKCFCDTFRNIREKSNVSANWSLSALREVFKRVTEESWRTSKEICCVLDAVDESEDGQNTGMTRREMAQWLSGIMRTRHDGLKIILTSRPANEIESAFKNFEQIILEKHNLADIALIIAAGIRELRQFINDLSDRQSEFGESLMEVDRNDTLLLYVNEDRSESQSSQNEIEYDDTSSAHVHDWRPESGDSTRNSLSAPSFVAHPQDDLEFVADHLHKHADGVILWVVLVLRELCNSVSKGFYTLREIKRKLESLPSGLEQVYEDIVKSLKGKLNPQQIGTAQVMLMWTCFPVRPLCLEEFRDAVAITVQGSTSIEDAEAELLENRVQIHGEEWTPMRRQMVEFCGCFVDVVNSTQMKAFGEDVLRAKPKGVEAKDIVQLVHQTAKDFLIRDPLAQSFRMEPGIADVTMTAGSVRYLTASVPLTALKAKPIDLWSETDYVKFVRHLEGRPLLSYAIEQIRRSTQQDIVQGLVKSIIHLDNDPRLHGWAFFEHVLIKVIGYKTYRPSLRSKSSLFRRRCIIVAVTEGFLSAFHSIVSTFVIDMATWTVCLNYAIENGHQFIIKSLFDMVQNLSPQPTKESLQSASILAVKKSDLSTLMRLSSLGLAPAATGSTLHLAAENGQSAVVDFLLHAGADPDATNHEGVTPLNTAVRHNHKNVARLLLSSRATRPSLREAATEKNPTLAEVLLETETNPAEAVNAPDSSESMFDPWERQYPLHIAITRGNIETARVFVQAGADINARGELSRTALHQVITWSSPKAAEFLLEQGASVDEGDNRNRTPLIEAAALGKIEHAKILLKYQPSINLQDFAGRSALHEATTSSNVDIVALFLAKGASRTEKDFWGMRPIDIAERDGNERLISLLKS